MTQPPPEPTNPGWSAPGTTPPGGGAPYGQQPYGSQAPYGQAPYPGQAPYGTGQYAPPPNPNADPNARSKLAAGLLGIFLGSLGIHRFYLGYTGIGLTMLLISVLSLGILSPLVGIWGLVEGILYLTAAPGSQWSVDADGRPLRN